jgi:hypothetical protein|tara:strand:+ start:25 stop:201 length:177 start_codon:yes stop_codon:yes gene_type:complete
MEMINLELTPEQARAAIYALILHTKDDSVDFPSDRVKLLREVIYNLDQAIDDTKETKE